MPVDADHDAGVRVDVRDIDQSSPKADSQNSRGPGTAVEQARSALVAALYKRLVAMKIHVYRE